MPESPLNATILKFEEVFRFREILGAETDRGCALTAAAYLDAELGSLLRGYMVDDHTVAERLLDSDHALGTFAARIDAAYMLGLIPMLATRDLHLIRKIRNDFAHDPWIVSFDTPSVASRCSELRHDVFEENLPARKRFMRVATGVAAFIHVPLATLPHRAPAEDIDFKATGAKAVSESVREIIEQYLRGGSASEGSEGEGAA